jgi:hypothetical protein
MNNLKKIIAVLSLFFAVLNVNAVNDTTENIIEKWLTAGPVKISKPVFWQEKNLHGKEFSASGLLKSQFATIKYPEEISFCVISLFLATFFICSSVRARPPGR